MFVYKVFSKIGIHSIGPVRCTYICIEKGVEIFTYWQRDVLSNQLSQSKIVSDYHKSQVIFETVFLNGHPLKMGQAKITFYLMF